MRKMPASCREIEPHLLASAMGEAAPAAVERVRVHVAGCPGCREELPMCDLLIHAAEEHPELLKRRPFIPTLPPPPATPS